jgi:hypothetical protein
MFLLQSESSQCDEKGLKHAATWHQEDERE